MLINVMLIKKTCKRLIHDIESWAHNEYDIDDSLYSRRSGLVYLPKSSVFAFFIDWLLNTDRHFQIPIQSHRGRFKVLLESRLALVCPLVKCRFQFYLGESFLHLVSVRYWWHGITQQICEFYWRGLWLKAHFVFYRTALYRLFCNMPTLWGIDVKFQGSIADVNIVIPKQFTCPSLMVGVSKK